MFLDVLCNGSGTIRNAFFKKSLSRFSVQDVSITMPNRDAIGQNLCREVLLIGFIDYVSGFLLVCMYIVNAIR